MNKPLNKCINLFNGKYKYKKRHSLCTVYSVQCTVYSVLSTVYLVLHCRPTMYRVGSRYSKA